MIFPEPKRERCFTDSKPRPVLEPVIMKVWDEIEGGAVGMGRVTRKRPLRTEAVPWRVWRRGDIFDDYEMRDEIRIKVSSKSSLCRVEWSIQETVFPSNHPLSTYTFSLPSVPVQQLLPLFDDVPLRHGQTRAIPLRKLSHRMIFECKIRLLSQRRNSCG